MNRNEQEHEITEREKRAWKDGSKTRKREHPELTMPQTIKFLKLLAQLASSATFERTLGLSTVDIEFYKTKFGVENQDDARRLYQRLEIAQVEGREALVISETKKARSAEEIANLRLKELELRRVIEQREKAIKTPDANKVRVEDAERQQRFQAEQEAHENEALSKSDPWFLPLSGAESDRRSLIDRFRKDIEYGGMAFCLKKYQASPIQIKAEAKRLDLKINWDNIKR